MTPQDVIEKVKHDAAEWLEMSEDPDKFISGILANKIITLEKHIQYLEKRVNDASEFKRKSML